MKYEFMTASSKRDLKYFEVIPSTSVTEENKEMMQMLIVSLRGIFVKRLTTSKLAMKTPSELVSKSSFEISFTNS